jgi:hypoxanthine phosphoribosyltransferase
MTAGGEGNAFDPAKIAVLYSEEALERIVSRLAEEINSYYSPITEEITAVCILKGSVHFYSDLLKRLELKVRYNFVHVSSYSGVSTTGRIRVKTWVDESVTDRYVLLVEDIVDTRRNFEIHNKLYLEAETGRRETGLAL